MRLCIVKYMLGRTVLDKLLEHPDDALILYAGVELAVGKCARSALAELHIALRVERAAAAKALNCLRASFGITPSLDDDGSQPRL